MDIEIATRLKPFTHLLGQLMMIPGSPWRIRVFPNRVMMENIETKSLKHVDFDFKGPVDGFTVELNLEQGFIKVFGKAQSGYFCYYIDKEGNIHEKSKPAGFIPTVFERLSLGSHKSQKWEAIRERENFIEIFPLWHRLGMLQSLIQENNNCLVDNSSLKLLKTCEQSIDANTSENILSHFRQIFLAGFEGILVPRLFDNEFNGILPLKEDVSQDHNAALTLLVLSARLIRSLFFQEKNDLIFLLPSLPPEFHCGRFTQISCGNKGCLNMEWTKKALRKVSFIAVESQELTFDFGKKKNSCRLRSSNSDKGIRYHSGSPIKIVAEQDYWFDHFE